MRIWNDSSIGLHGQGGCQIRLMQIERKMSTFNILYKISFIIGVISLILKFFIYIEGVDFFAIGYFILGSIFLVNYYFNSGYRNQVQFWWQNVLGFSLIFCNYSG